MIEMSISEILKDAEQKQRPIPDALVVVFTTVNTLLVCVHLLALMMSTCILPHLDAVAMAMGGGLEHMEDATGIETAPSVLRAPTVEATGFLQQQQLLQQQQQQQQQQMGPDLNASAGVGMLQRLTSVYPPFGASATASAVRMQSPTAVEGPQMRAIQTLRESPHEKMRVYIEIAWFCSNTLGILLFIASLALLVWIKVYPLTLVGAFSCSAVLVPVLLLLVLFGFHFYQRLMTHHSSLMADNYGELEREFYRSFRDDPTNPMSPSRKITVATLTSASNRFDARKMSVAPNGFLDMRRPLSSDSAALMSSPPRDESDSLSPQMRSPTNYEMSNVLRPPLDGSRLSLQSTPVANASRSGSVSARQSIFTDIALPGNSAQQSDQLLYQNPQRLVQQSGGDGDLLVASRLTPPGSPQSFHSASQHAHYRADGGADSAPSASGTDLEPEPEPVDERPRRFVAGVGGSGAPAFSAAHRRPRGRDVQITISNHDTQPF